jgi:hypothetical protein
MLSVAHDGMVRRLSSPVRRRPAKRGTKVAFT